MYFFEAKQKIQVDKQNQHVQIKEKNLLPLKVEKIDMKYKNH